MEELLILPLLLFGWFALFRWGLPAIGISSCLSGRCGNSIECPPQIETKQSTYTMPWIEFVGSGWRAILEPTNRFREIGLSQIRSVGTDRVEPISGCSVPHSMFHWVCGHGVCSLGRDSGARVNTHSFGLIGLQEKGDEVFPKHGRIFDRQSGETSLLEFAEVDLLRARACSFDKTGGARVLVEVDQDRPAPAGTKCRVNRRRQASAAGFSKW